MATLSISYASATTQAFLASAVLSDTSLATGRAATPFSNATFLYSDVLFSGNLKLATGLTINTQFEIWIAAPIAGLASQLTANCPTSEGAITPLGEKFAMALAYVHTVTASATANERTVDFGPISIGSLFGGVVPSAMNAVVFQNTGVALGTGTTTTFNYFAYQGINYTSV
jgi:hypothetical protein